MNYLLFEDERFQNLLPLVYFRPVWELRCGALELWQKIALHTSQKLHFLARPYLLDYYLNPRLTWTTLREDDETFALNGRGIFDAGNLGLLTSLQIGEMLISDSQPLAFRILHKDLRKLLTNGVVDTSKCLQRLKPVACEAKLINYPWDAIDWNGLEIGKDFSSGPSSGQVLSQPQVGAHLLNPEKIYIAPNVVIEPGVVLNAGKGPIWIEEGARVMANSVVMGPAFIGRESIVKIGAKIYENTSIGPVCKVGGEIEDTIIQGYSNKQHDGFLGHSYLGSWVNLGAGTNNSDLKNNYGEITVYLNGEAVFTGRQFLGLIMGDHSKSAINTMFNTGTIVGVNCNIFGADMPPKFVPSFSWGGTREYRPYDFNKAVEVAKKVMGRRQRSFTENDLALFRSVKNLAETVEKRTISDA